jgi:hypothetical protein
MLEWLAGGCLVIIVIGAAFLFTAALVDSLLGED